MSNIQAIEKRLWSVADQLRANSNFASNEYFMPVMGLIFLRHAYSRYKKVASEIENDPDWPRRGGKPKKPTTQDFAGRGSIFLDEKAQFDYLNAIPDGEDRAAAIIAAMDTIEKTYPALKGSLPKQEYQELGNDDLGQLLRTFSDPELENADGDVFGRIYEYFLTQFADQKAHDGGEFFTPPSIVQTIVNVIEPDHGKILDPACGSGGMFVQSAHFIERQKENPSEKVTFFGMEKNPTTIRLAKMNLAVHGLEGNIQKAISYYADPHKKNGPFDFVMANPPFNVDEIDAEKIKNDSRLTFGLPGINKIKKKVSNGNYVWMSYFHSYLSEKGRAGVVMSSQASSAGGQEAKVRESMVKSGDVSIMMAIRGNFFYTRTVPCELWFFNKAKPEEHKDKVLMLDARQIYRKVTRAVYDFSPEQMKNLTSIVWLYRGERERFTSLVGKYLSAAQEEAHSSIFDDLLRSLNEAHAYFNKHVDGDEIQQQIDLLTGEIGSFKKAVKKLPKVQTDIAALHKSLSATTPAADQAKQLIKEIDRLSKLLQKAHSETVETGEKPSEGKKQLAAVIEQRELLTGDPNETLEVTGSLKRLRYFLSQAGWLLIRFPEAELVDVEGLVKLVDKDELKENAYSLTPGRYVGVAPEVEDEDFDFDEVMKSIHEELESLNDEASVLAETISKNYKDIVV